MNTNNVRDLLRVNANSKPLDSALQAQLFDAVRVGDCLRIVVLIEEGADPNAIGLKGFNALHLACHAKDEATAGQLITTLVERGANINVPCTRGGTPQTHLKESGLGLDATRRLLKLTERLGANDFLTGLACMTVDPVKHCPGLRCEEAPVRPGVIGGYVVVRDEDQVIRGSSATQADADALAVELTAEDEVAHTVLPASFTLTRQWQDWLWEKVDCLVNGQVIQMAVIDRVGFGGVA